MYSIPIKKIGRALSTTGSMDQKLLAKAIRIVAAVKLATQADAKISEVDIDKSVANAADLSQAAMSGNLVDEDQPATPEKSEIQASTKEHVPVKQNDDDMLAGCAVLGAIGLGMFLGPGLIVGPILGALGFGSGGIVGGSIAAGIQAGMGGNIAAGSAFAVMQGAGAGGAALAAVNGVV